jgi:hypothetical protein
MSYGVFDPEHVTVVARSFHGGGIAQSCDMALQDQRLSLVYFAPADQSPKHAKC